MRRQCTTPTPKKNTYCPIYLGMQYAGMGVVVIPLSSGAHTIVDIADFPKVSGYPWYEARTGRNTTYARSDAGTRTDRVRLSMHRLVLDNPEGMVVDHINRNGLDNRRCNLRILTSNENKMNSSQVSGRFKGVSYCHLTGKWKARIQKDGKVQWLGRFVEPEEAARAYDQAALIFHGPHAYLNFPEDHEMSSTVTDMLTTVNHKRVPDYPIRDHHRFAIGIGMLREWMQKIIDAGWRIETSYFDARPVGSVHVQLTTGNWSKGTYRQVGGTDPKDFDAAFLRAFAAWESLHEDLEVAR